MWLAGILSVLMLLLLIRKNLPGYSRAGHRFSDRLFAKSALNDPHQRGKCLLFIRTIADKLDFIA